METARRCLSVVLLLVGLARAPHTVLAEQTPERVAVAGTKVSMTPPPDFEPAQQFPGFQQIETGSSIVVTEVAGAPFSEIRGAMTRENMATQGMKLLSLDDVRIAGSDGVLLAITQTVFDITYRKWLGTFGTAEGTVVVTATFPAAASEAVVDAMKAAVLSVEWNPTANVGRLDGLQFRITETATLKIARRMANLIALTRHGQPGSTDATEPLLVVGSSLGAVPIDNLETFARSRLAQTSQVTGLRDIRGASTVVGALPAYEITAAASDVRSGAPITVYQLMLLRDDVYYLVLGLVGEASASQFLPEFKAVAHSLTFVD